MEDINKMEFSIGSYSIIFGIFIFFCFSACEKPVVDQPNVLFISVDDLRPELGCYGNEIVQSPNIDRLASEGVVFKNHFVQVPTCGASRFGLLTGMRPSKGIHLSNKAIELELSNKPEQNRPESFIHQLKRHGYYTVGIGKISHSADGLVYGYEEPVSNNRELPNSWSELIFNAGKWGTGWNSFLSSLTSLPRIGTVRFNCYQL